MSAHALLGPSGASRWLACTPSARLEQSFPDTAGEAAAEGTLAHSLAELILEYKTKRILKKVYTARLKEIQANALYSDEMLSLMDEFSVFVLEKLSHAQRHTSDAGLFLETKLDLTEYVPDGFGTGDVCIVADHVLEITDLKYGKGVEVSAHENKQMMLYALGALDAFGHLYDIQQAVMTIYQPRMKNISSFEMSVADLRSWAENYLKPRALMAHNGEGEFAPGDACKFCKAKPRCKALADYNNQLARHEFKNPELITDEEVSEILSRTDLFTSWLKVVNDYALAEALKGHKWPDYKLVEGRSNRAYTNEDEISKVLIAKGLKEEDIFTKKLLGITAMEKSLGKSDFATHLGSYVIKPAGKPTLVPASDKRPEYNSADGAAADFAEVLAEQDTN